MGGVELEMLVGSGATNNTDDEETWENLKAYLFDKSQAFAPAACELCVVSECSYEVPILC